MRRPAEARPLHWRGGWYVLHGHASDDVTAHRARARWHTTKAEPSYDDMAVKLRRVIIAAQISRSMP